MRGLPPPPPLVARLTLDMDHAGAPSSAGVWLFLPELGLAPASDVQQAFDDLSAMFIDLAMGSATTNTTVRTCHFSSVAPVFYSLSNPVAEVSGEWSGSTPNVCCADYYLGTSTGGKSGRTIIHIPGFPNEFTDDEEVLNEHGRTVMQAAIETFATRVNAYSFGALLSVQLVACHFQADGAPLSAATFEPVTFVRPVWKIGYLGRRMSRRR